jgi:hypothetical protein
MSLEKTIKLRIEKLSLELDTLEKKNERTMDFRSSAIHDELEILYNLLRKEKEDTEQEMKVTLTLSTSIEDSPELVAERISAMFGNSDVMSITGITVTDEQALYHS